MLKPNLRRSLRPTLNNCMGGGSPPVAESFVARTNGTDQSWALSESIVIPENTDFKLGLDIMATSDGYTGVLSATGGDFLRFLAKSQTHNLQMFIGGSYLTLIPYSTGINLRDGVYRRIMIKRESLDVSVSVGGGEYIQVSTGVTGSFSIDALSRYLSSEFPGVIANFEVEVSGVKTNEIPLTNKDQGATQIATIGTVNAAMVNYTPDVWELKNQPPQSTQQASFQQAKAGEESEVDEGSWSGSAPITYTYQWQLDNVDIVGATAKTLLVIAGMIGQSLRCVVTATNQYGSSTSITAAVVVTI